MCPPIDRRSVLQAAGAATFLAIAAPLPAEAGVLGGCKVALNRQRPSNGIAVVGQDAVLGTGSQERDKMLGRALVRMSQTFGERPTFAFYDDSDSPNAYADDVVESDVPGTWGIVRFGHQLHADLTQKHEDSGIAVLSVLAHEFGHVAQYHRGVMSALVGRTVKRAELHADLLSGYYLGLRKIANSALKLRSAGIHLYSIGDLAYNDRQHHGTAEERVEASEYGFSLAHEGRDLDYVFKRGTQWVMDRYSERA